MKQMTKRVSTHVFSLAVVSILDGRTLGCILDLANPGTALSQASQDATCSGVDGASLGELDIRDGYLWPRC
jgi:hypothetical protein